MQEFNKTISKLVDSKSIILNWEIWVLTALIFLVSLFCSYILPKTLSKKNSPEKFFAITIYFTGGLQLATMLLELIPDMFEESHAHLSCKNFNQLDEFKNEESGHHHHHEINYPLFVTGLTFLFLFSVDKLFLNKKKSSSEVNNLVKNNSELNNINFQRHSHGASSHIVLNLEDNNLQKNETSHYKHIHGPCNTTVGICNMDTISSANSKFKAFFFIFAISLHSFFEGLNIKGTHVLQDPYTYGIILHKLLESFAIGVAILQSKFKKFMILAVYSALTPIGIILGNFSGQIFPELIRYFTGISLGSLIFVVFFEMIGHSFVGENTFMKLVFLFAGFLIGFVAIMFS